MALNAQTTPSPTGLSARKSTNDPIEFLKESKCWFKGKGYSGYSVGYIVRSYVSAGRIKNLQWSKAKVETASPGWVITLSYFDTKEGKKRKARWNIDKNKKTAGDSENQFLSSVPGEKYTHWPGANQMDVIE